MSRRFYTTDFDEMEDLFDAQKHNLNTEGVEQLLSSLEEFRKDYNQKHFVRNETFKAAADNLKGPIRKIFVEFLERGCTAGALGHLQEVAAWRDGCVPEARQGQPVVGLGRYGRFVERLGLPSISAGC